jgi:hypothetical protein
VNIKETHCYQAAIDKLIDSFKEQREFSAHARVRLRELYLRCIEDGEAITDTEVKWILKLQKNSIMKRAA